MLLELSCPTVGTFEVWNAFYHGENAGSFQKVPGPGSLGVPLRAGDLVRSPYPLEARGSQVGRERNQANFSA